MLKQPRSKNICRNFWENTALFLVLFAIGIIIFFTRTFSTTYTSITCITYKIEGRKIIYDTIKLVLLHNLFKYERLLEIYYIA